MIGLGEEGFTVEISSDSFMLGEFKSVIEGKVWTNGVSGLRSARMA